MAFNPYFPATYQPMNPYPTMQNQYAQMQQQMQVQQAAPQGGLVWVQGVEGAKSYPVSAGQSVLLMDSESNCFFIKAADASGMPLPLRVFDYTERTAQNQQQAPQKVPIDTSAFITREEFEARIAQLSAQESARRKPQKKEMTENAE